MGKEQSEDQLTERLCGSRQIKYINESVSIEGVRELGFEPGDDLGLSVREPEIAGYPNSEPDDRKNADDETELRAMVVIHTM